MNVMSDMTQFAVFVPAPNEISVNLTVDLMQHVLLKIGTYHLVILNNRKPFKDVFPAIFKALNINFDILATKNQKTLLVEIIYRSINKSITITTEDRGTNDVFLSAGVRVEYALNRSPINGNDILRSVRIIGRELRFPLDIGLSSLPPLTYNIAESVISYLPLTDFNCFFISEFLKILMEDRKTSHAKRINNNRNVVTIHPGYLVMTRTATQKDKVKDKVTKLSYTVRSLFQIVPDT